MTARTVILLLLAFPAASAAARDALPGRGRIPKDATLCAVWTVDVDEVDELVLHRAEAETVHVEGKPPRRSETEVLVPLPRRELGLFARFRRGRGKVEVVQDPSRKNRYRGIVRVTDNKRGWAKQVVEIYFGPRPDPPPPFPVVLPDVTSNERPAFWGERDGPERAIAAKAPMAFSWTGRVQGYAVLSVGPHSVALSAPRGTATTAASKWNAPVPEGHYLVLSVCDGPDYARVVQRMNVAAESRAFIELNAKGTCHVVAHVVPQTAIDALHPPPPELKGVWETARTLERQRKSAEAASHWIDAAVRTPSSVSARIWAIEQFCRLQPYPGPELSTVEKLTLAKLAAQEPVVPLTGRNMIFAWPKEYLERTPIRWRFLAETDAAMEWLRYWTGKDQVRARGKRMISRFRADDGGIALYVGFRLHIPRAEMRCPPDHGPYSHEVSHGYIVFPALSPTGRYNEGLTEVARISYWWFLGEDERWRRFERKCLETIKRHYEDGGDLGDVPGYAGAAGVYLALARRFCALDGNSIDWRRFAALFRAAGGKRGFGQLAAEAERAFGADARVLIEQLRLP